MQRVLLLFSLCALLTGCGSGAASAPPPAPTSTTPAGSGPDAGPAQLAALQRLTQRLGVPVSEVNLLSTEAVDWPDSCLGIVQPDALCAAVVTPGFRIIFDVNGATYEFHTNRDGSVVAEVAVTLIWHREGGLAGFCDVLAASTSGAVQAGACNDEPRADTLTEAERAQLQQWAQAYGGVVIVVGDPAVADALFETLEMSGLGPGQPDEAARQAMLAWAQAVYQRLRPAP
jgi:hypothetical protein